MVEGDGLLYSPGSRGGSLMVGGMSGNDPLLQLEFAIFFRSRFRLHLALLPFSGHQSELFGVGVIRLRQPVMLDRCSVVRRVAGIE